MDPTPTHAGPPPQPPLSSFKPPSPPPPPEEIPLWPVFRDIGIVFGLTFFGGCIAGAWGATTGANPAGTVLAVAVSNLICGTIAFTISGVLATPPRWRHLFFVGLGSWLLSIINVFAFGVPVQQWLMGAIAMAITMGAGGGLSYIFKPNRPRP